MNKTTKTILGLVVLILIIGGIYFLNQKTSGPVSDETIKIGVILPLTGELATYGEGVKNAIDLAVEKSGFKDKIQIIAEDDHGCLSPDAVSAAQKLINLDKVTAIIGSLCTGSSLAIAPITEQNKLILIAPTATGKNLTDAGEYVFRTIASDADKSIAVANYAFEKGFRKVALLFDSSQDALVSQRDDVKEAFTKLGGQVVVEESFVTKDRDLRSQLIKVKNTDADVIFISAIPETLGVALKEAETLGLTTQFISTETSAGTQMVIDLAGTSSENLIFPFATTPENVEYNNFINDYKTAYGVEPTVYAAEGYDAGMLLIKSLFASDGTTDDIKKELFKIGNNYYGASGVITFDQNGDVQKPMVIKTIKNGQFVEVE